MGIKKRLGAVTMTMDLIYTVAAGCVGLLIGYAFGRLDLIYRALLGVIADRSVVEQPRDFFTTAAAEDRRARTSAQNKQSAASQIDIDDKKFVAPISTAGMENKTAAALGKTTAIADDINSSVSKLAQLKGK